MLIKPLNSLNSMLNKQVALSFGWGGREGGAGEFDWHFRSSETHIKSILPFGDITLDALNKLSSVGVMTLFYS